MNDEPIIVSIKRSYGDAVAVFFMELAYNGKITSTQVSTVYRGHVPRAAHLTVSKQIAKEYNAACRALSLLAMASHPAMGDIVSSLSIEWVKRFLGLLDKLRKTDIFEDEHIPLINDLRKCLEARALPLGEGGKVSNTGYVYLIRGSGGEYKIGYARNPKSRTEVFRIELPFDIEVLHTIRTDDMRRAEKYLHQMYAAKRVRGEWFRLADEDVISILAIDELIYGNAQQLGLFAPAAAPTEGG